MRILNLTVNSPNQLVQDLLNADIEGKHWLSQGHSDRNQLRAILGLVHDKATGDELSDALVVQYLPRGKCGFLKFLNWNHEGVDTDDNWRLQLIKEAITVLNKYAQRSGHQSCYEMFSMVPQNRTRSALKSKWSKQCKSLYSAGFRMIETEKSSSRSVPFETVGCLLVYKPHLLANFQVEDGVKAGYIESSVVSDVCEELRSVIDCSEDGQREAKELGALTRLFKEASPKMTPIHVRPSFPWSGLEGPSPATQVAVVGGGLAGLAAASSLSEAGFDVVLLEASNYLGGRVKQVQPFEGFAPIDLGGEFIHGSRTVISRIAKKNNWVVRPDYDGGDIEKEEKLYYKGKLYPVSSDQPEIKAAREAWTEVIDVDSDPAENVSTQAPSSDVLKVRLEQSGASADVLQLIDGWKVKISAGSLEHYGVLEGRRRMESKHEWGLNNFRLAKSYSQLVEYYLSKCEDVDKRLEWQVKDVVWKGEESNEPNPKGRILVRNHLGDVLTANYLIITVPITVLKDGDISFVPDLSVSKKKAIDTIRMRGAMKIVCRFSKHFWPQTLDQVYSIVGFVNEVWMYTLDSADRDDPCHLIAGFATAETAEEKAGLSGQDVLDGFLRHLDEIFGSVENPHPASESFMDYAYFHWSNHPFVRGGYTSATAHAYDLRQELASSLEDRVFFAGEATSLRSCSTVPTAIETGIRVAGEVCRVCGIPPPEEL